MKIKSIIMIVAIVSLTCLFGQEPTPSPIMIKKTFLSYSYYQNGEKLSYPNLNKVLATASDDIKTDLESAKKNRMIGMVFSFPGGWLIGYPIGQAIGSGEEIDMTQVTAGLFLGGMGTFFEYQSYADYKKAIDKYNRLLTQP